MDKKKRRQDYRCSRKKGRRSVAWLLAGGLLLTAFICAGIFLAIILNRPDGRNIKEENSETTMIQADSEEVPLDESVGYADELKELIEEDLPEWIDANMLSDKLPENYLIPPVSR